MPRRAQALLFLSLLGYNLSAMEIIKADVLGFCKGVENAISIVIYTCEEYRGRSIKIYGELAHNKKVIGYIERLGAMTIHSLDEINSSDVVIIRAHGISDAERKYIEKTASVVIDATCPLVLRNQEKMRASALPTLIFGIKGHSETKAVEGVSSSWYKVVTVPEDLDGLDVTEKYSVIMQTTFESSLSSALFARLDSMGISYNVSSSVCYASKKRREALKKLASTCDMIVVIGDRMSANTNALRNEAEGYGVKAVLIEREDEIEESMFSSVRRLGISAGSSAPPFQIDAIIKRIRSVCDGKENANEVE